MILATTQISLRIAVYNKLRQKVIRCNLASEKLESKFKIFLKNYKKYNRNISLWKKIKILLNWPQNPYSGFSKSLIQDLKSNFDNPNCGSNMAAILYAYS